MPSEAVRNGEREELEVRLLLDAVYSAYGYDFREYAPASLKRRIRHCVREEGLATVSGLQERILHQAGAVERLLLALSVHVTAMFRDPAFFAAFRARAVPLLRDQPFLRLWIVGCASGEEVYSMAILLEEEGLLDRTRIYATDFNEAVLAQAREGVYPLAAMREHTANYLKAGGKAAFSDYYTARYDRAIFRAGLRRNLVFAQHNLVTDSSFNEFHAILCRNVMIYFNRSLQGRVHQLLYDSLAPGGLLGLGLRESLRCTPHQADYEELDAAAKLYRRAR